MNFNEEVSDSMVWNDFHLDFEGSVASESEHTAMSRQRL